MPALRQEYDYYEYARNRQGTVKNAVPSSALKKRTTSNGKNRIDSKNSSTQKLNLKTSTTRDVTKNATRVATRDDNFIGMKKSITNSKSNSKVATKQKNNASNDFLTNNKKGSTYAKPQEISLKRPKSNVTAKSVEKQKIKVKQMFKNFTVASLIFGMLFLICYRYSCINEAFSELNDLKSDLRNQQTLNSQIESNIQANTDLSYIENYAKYQLGMQKPKESQIQKISVKKQDKIITPIEIKEEEEKGVISTIFLDLLELLD